MSQHPHSSGAGPSCRLIASFMAATALLATTPLWSSQPSPSAATYAVYKTALYLCGSVEDETCIEEAGETIQQCSLLKNELKRNEIGEETAWEGINALAKKTKEDVVLLANRIAWLCTAQKAFLELVGLKDDKTVDLSEIQMMAFEKSGGDVGQQIMKMAEVDCGAGGLPEVGDELFSNECGLTGGVPGADPSPIDPLPTSTASAGGGGPVSTQQPATFLPEYLADGPCGHINPIYLIKGGVFDETPQDPQPPPPEEQLPAPPVEQPPPQNGPPQQLPDGVTLLRGPKGPNGVLIEVELDHNGLTLFQSGAGSFSGGFEGGGVTGLGISGENGSIGGGAYTGATVRDGQFGWIAGVGITGTFMPPPHTDSGIQSGLAGVCRQQFFKMVSACVGLPTQPVGPKAVMCGLVIPGAGGSGMPIDTMGMPSNHLFKSASCVCKEVMGKGSDLNVGKTARSLQTGTRDSKTNLPCCPSRCLVSDISSADSSCSGCIMCKSGGGGGKSIWDDCAGLGEPIASKICGNIDPVPQDAFQ